MSALKPGTTAPSFSLLASSREVEGMPAPITEKTFRGRPLILAFYPADWTPVCGDQLALYNAVLPEFNRLGAEIVGVSVDGAFCHQAFAHERGIRFPLLADFEPKGKMARDFGVYRAADGVAERALFVLDGDGVIQWSHVSPPEVNPGADGILRALERMRTKPVTLVEYGDYECPHCRRAHRIVEPLREKLGERLQFQFKNFPLTQIHPHALHAAEAAMSVRAHAGEAAFWAMHEAIFAHQKDGVNALDDAHLAQYAEEVGADGAQVRSDLDTEKFEESVQTEFMEGVYAGVNATPTFFINGERFDGDWRKIEELEAAIETAAAESMHLAQA